MLNSAAAGHLAYADDTRERLPLIVGAVAISVARTFKVLEPGLKNPQTEHWHRAEEIFDMLL